ncbi:MAG: hypothetical protein V5A16_00415, partial [Haloplanus sp.]
AGVPDPVVERSRTLVGGDRETNGHDERVQVTLDGVDVAAGGDGHGDVIADRLREADLARTTPIEALNLLAELQDRLER